MDRVPRDVAGGIARRAIYIKLEGWESCFRFRSVLGLRHWWWVPSRLCSTDGISSRSSFVSSANHDDKWRASSPRFVVTNICFWVRTYRPGAPTTMYHASNLTAPIPLLTSTSFLILWACSRRRRVPWHCLQWWCRHAIRRKSPPEKAWMLMMLVRGRERRHENVVCWLPKPCTPRKPGSGSRFPLSGHVAISQPWLALRPWPLFRSYSRTPPFFIIQHRHNEPCPS